MLYFHQVKFDNVIKKHSLSKPIESRIVRINLPAAENGMYPCLEVELHGIITEETGIKCLQLFFTRPCLLLFFESGRFLRYLIPSI